MVRLTVPYRFTHNFTRKRHRTEQGVWDRGSVELEIVEVDRRDVSPVARVALEKRYQSKNITLNFGVKDDDGLREIVWHANECWIEFDRVETLVEKLSVGSDGDGTPFHGLGHYPPVTNPKPFVEEQFLKEVGPLSKRSSSEPTVLERLKSRAAETISIDGLVYRRISEPYPTASRYLGRALQGDSIEYDVVGLSMEGKEAALNSSLPLDVQCRRLDRIGGLRMLGVRLEVLDPSRLYQMPERQLAIKAAHSILGTLMPNLEDLPIGALDASYALRDALTDSPRHLSPPVIAALEAVADLAEPDTAWLLRAGRVYESRRFNSSYHSSKPNTLGDLLGGVYGVIKPRARQVLDLAAGLDPAECSDALLSHAPTHYSDDGKYIAHEVTSREVRRSVARLLACDPEDVEAMAKSDRIVIVEDYNRHSGPDVRGTVLAVARLPEDGFEVLFSRDGEHRTAAEAVVLARYHADLTRDRQPDAPMPGARP